MDIPRSSGTLVAIAADTVPWPAKSGSRRPALASAGGQRDWPVATWRRILRDGGDAGMEQRVRLAAGRVRLAADLAMPAAAKGVVLFAHGSGSGRLSPRNRLVAAKLQQAGLATLLLDLLTVEEETAERAGGRLRFDVQLLAGRLAAALDWLATQRHTVGLPVGLFGASTGAGAALLVAADRPAAVTAVVSRGGRPDLAGAALGRVRAPTLLVVGARDRTVLALNRAALERLAGAARLEVVPGASHLFPEPGALERVAELAVAWFLAHLPGVRHASRKGPP
jgi:putative phosphoribosyl transferase